MTLCSVSWAQFDVEGGTEDQTDLIVAPSEPAANQPAVERRENNNTTRTRENRTQSSQPSAGSGLTMEGNFQSFIYQTDHTYLSTRSGQYSAGIGYRDITDFSSLAEFVTDNPSVVARPTAFVEAEGPVVWFYQEIQKNNKMITVKAFGIDFVKQEWADRFMEVTQDLQVSLFLKQPSRRGDVVPMHQVIVTKPEQKEIYFLPSGIANISDSYKDQGMPYAKGKNLVDAFYAHIEELSEKFNDTGICSMFFDEEYEVNKDIAAQDDGIQKIAQLFPDTYDIFSQASDYIHNDNYTYIRDTGVIFSRVDQECNLSTLWNEFFYYIFLHGIQEDPPLDY
jgi:hypothetical protein